MNKLKLPKLGTGIDKAVVVHWHFEEGETVSSDDDLVEVVTDKATFNVPAGADGVINEILVEVGKEVKVGEALAVIQ